MPYTYTLTTTIPASPEEIYEAWLDSLTITCVHLWLYWVVRAYE